MLLTISQRNLNDWKSPKWCFDKQLPWQRQNFVASELDKLFRIVPEVENTVNSSNKVCKKMVAMVTTIVNIWLFSTKYTIFVYIDTKSFHIHL